MAVAVVVFGDVADVVVAIFVIVVVAMLTFLIIRCKCLSVVLFGFYIYSLLSVAEDQETDSAFGSYSYSGRRLL